MKTDNAILFLLLIVVILALMIAGPILTILSLNALFGLGIGVSAATYFSMVWLHFLIIGGIAKAKNTK